MHWSRLGLATTRSNGMPLNWVHCLPHPPLPLLLCVGTFFTEDSAVKAACHYWSTGEPPKTFKWLSTALYKRHRKEHGHHAAVKRESVLATAVPVVSSPPAANTFKTEASIASETPGPSKAVANPLPLSTVLQRWIAAFAHN